MAAPTPIIPPNPIEANVDYRYDGCYQSMVLVLLQRVVDESSDTDLIAKLQEIIDELTELNGKVATETTLEAARVLLASLDSKDFATETTLAAIKAQTDLLNFTGAKLRTTGEDASGGGGSSSYGDNATISTVALTDVSSTVVTANTDRKETVYYNDSNNLIWLYFGTPAVFGTGIPLVKQQQLVNERYRGQVTAIMDTGKTGNLQVTDVTL